jgi:predicted HAD superfamily phosphohydrolase YqeG
MKPNQMPFNEAMRKTISEQLLPDKVYLLLCDGVVTDVFTSKEMAMYDLHTCIKADAEEGLPHEWRVIARQLNTSVL